jgi:hypothetical protein
MKPDHQLLHLIGGIETNSTYDENDIRKWVLAERQRQVRQQWWVARAAATILILFLALGWSLYDQSRRVHLLVGSRPPTSLVDLETVMTDIGMRSVPEYFRKQLEQPHGHRPINSIANRFQNPRGI